MATEPHTLLAMSPGRKWASRVSLLLFWLLFICLMVSQLLSDQYTPAKRGVLIALTSFATVVFLHTARTTSRGVRLDPPDEFAPERYPPEQRRRARMQWGECILTWVVIGGAVALAIWTVSGVADEWRRAVQS